MTMVDANRARSGATPCDPGSNRRAARNRVCRAVARSPLYRPYRAARIPLIRHRAASLSPCRRVRLRAMRKATAARLGNRARAVQSRDHRRIA
ncbi:hypothetical protein Bmul_0658 [Burkholderia multivorans ATCC 17616]|nr:hypothetical protein Bmul_0658 [Burkholderia multivorans ATCC 17616]